MYPRISDLINDLFGTDILLPIQSFGFFVALAFLVAYWLLDRELKRKQAAGIFSTRTLKEAEGGPLKETEIVVNFALFGLIGYKLGLMFEDYQGFASDPQGAILSAEGSFLWALIFAVVGGGYKFYQYWQRRNDKPKMVEVTRGIRDEMGTIFTIAFVAGILGAKIFHNLEYWDNFVEDPIRALTSFDGLTFYGGLICAAVGIAWYVRKKGFPVLPFADAVAPALILGYGVGRIGCQTAGDGDWGIVNVAPKPDWLSWIPDWAWAYDYPHNVLKRGVPIEGCEGEYCMRLAETVFPTPFYETLMAVGIFALLWALRKHLPFWGQISGLYLFFNGLERFLIEKIRVNATLELFGREVTQAEIISTLLMVAGLLVFFLATYKWKFGAAKKA